MKTNLNNKLLFFVVFFSFLTFYSCFERIKEDITKELDLDISKFERTCNNDSVDLFIKRIIIESAIRNKNYLHSAPPSVFLEILLINKTDKTLKISELNNDKQSAFVSILGSDTISLTQFYNHNVYFTLSKDTTSFFLSFSYFDLPLSNYKTDGDNTELILFYLKKMNFYYLPSKDMVSENISDTISLNNKYCIEINSVTKIYNEDEVLRTRCHFFDYTLFIIDY